MKKILAATILVVAVLSSPLMAENPCDQITLETIREHAPIPPAKIVAKNPVLDICEVILDIQSELVPVYATKDYIIAGEMFSRKTQITEARLNTLKGKTFLANINDVMDAIAFEYTPSGPVRHTVYMFSSPSCPHCSNALKSIKDVLDRNHAALKVLFQAQGDARSLAIEAVCKNVDLDTYNSKGWVSKNSADRKLCTEGIKIVDKSTAVSQRLGITGVPLFYLENGIIVAGNNMPELDRVLKN